ncbi:MAG: DUF58 domain-containing protein [Bacteroidales bacterium]|nr:DUF58 domain-containing protein [Bacteroidales bacterium]MCF8392098.1 DUF58 domain-containing protein [Bacteroidales bacterium]
MAEVETSELLKRVRTIEIKTRGLTRQVFAGEYHSAFKGRGVTFSEVREYLYGDDIRNIDWNVTARYNHPYVKIYEEERELTVVLLIDVSGSRNFGSLSQLKKNVITEISAVLSFSAILNNDKIGVIFFSDKVEKYIPPKKGRKHILHIIRELIEFKPESNKSDLTEALKFLSNVIKKRCTAFILSDFMVPDFENSLKVARKKHDVVALNIYDKRETEMPDIGLVKFLDPETSKVRWVDTSLASVRKDYADNWRGRMDVLQNLFVKNSIDYTSINTSEDYVRPLLGLFKRR